MLEMPGGRRQSFCIVGEDEADPKKGLISYVAPLARELIGKELEPLIVGLAHDLAASDLLQLRCNLAIAGK